MSWVRRLIHLLERLLHRGRLEWDLDDEVQSYFDILIERGMARGLSREDAQRAARIEFEGPEQVKHRVREARVGVVIEKTLQDVRYALRTLKKTPGFTLFAVLSIALGLGANTAIFSLVDGVLLKSSGYAEPERIVQLWEKQPSGVRNVLSPANYLDWVHHSRSFASMAAQTWSTMSYTGGSEPQSLPTGIVSASYFNVFGTKAVLGRTFAQDEGQPGKEKVVVLSHRVWLNLFGGDRGVIGREILLNGDRYTVIGVLPGASEFDRRGEDIWIPLALPIHVARDYYYLVAFARLKQGLACQRHRRR